MRARGEPAKRATLIANGCVFDGTARRLRELVIGAYSTGGQYVGPWAQAYYESMGEVMVGKKQ